MPDENHGGSVMPLLLIVLDGVCNNEYEHIESLKHAIRRGSRNNTPLGMETDSLNCILTMLGVSKEHIPSGRAYLEALAAGLYVGPHDVVLRGPGSTLRAGAAGARRARSTFRRAVV